MTPKRVMRPNSKPAKQESSRESRVMKVERVSGESRIEPGPSFATEEVKDERTSSPDPPCSICLSELNNKSYTDSCCHTFCFNCLKEWSQIKAECPLCKKVFTTIIHNIRSLNDYDVHRVTPINNFLPGRFYDLLVDPSSFERIIQPGRSPVSSLRSPVRSTRSQGSFLYVSDSPMIPSYAVLPTSIEFRRAIYHEGLWVRNTGGNRQRECSPEFYRRNEAQTHRLLPWLSRELSVLLDVSMNVHSVVERIQHLLVTHPITSTTFRNSLLHFLGPRTDHFLHEFYNYAISPEPTMQIYDFNAEYSPVTSTRPRNRSLFNSFLRSLDDHDSFGSSLMFGNHPDNGLVGGVRRAAVSTINPEVYVVTSDSNSSDVLQIVSQNEQSVHDSDSDDSVQIIDIPPKPIELITIDDSDDDGHENVIPNAPNRNDIPDIYANPQPSTSFHCCESRVPLITISSSSSISSSSPSSSSEDESRHRRLLSTRRRKRKSKRSLTFRDLSPSPKRKCHERRPSWISSKSKKDDKENFDYYRCYRRLSHSSSDSDFS